MYEMIVLGFFMRYPMHGYRISKIVNDIVGPYTKFSSGRLYPLLAKLEQQAFITPAGAPNEDRQRMFQITESGQKHFFDVIMDTTSNQGEYQKLFWYKIIFFDLLTQEQRTYLLDHYINYCQTHVFYIQSELDDLQQRLQNSDGQLSSVITVMNRNINFWKSDLEYVQNIRNQIGG
ncbi:PadR family transcriptional regulator [Cohnella lupini]|uniref:PadR family transcriptional regulator n=2 Tax=Cohnella lupini TaxID=1294267 RepID=A0A3D9I1Q4_9BACL|nr:PadR family transcriptional regulator [Cohnella lupini]